MAWVRVQCWGTNMDNAIDLFNFEEGIKYLDKLRSVMYNQRGAFEPEWKKLAQYILPKRARYYNESDDGESSDDYSDIMNNTATYSATTLKNGMMAGITSPYFPWFRLTTRNQDHSESEDVKIWLEDVRQRMFSVFEKSNLYDTLPIIYGDLGVFGTGVMIMEECLDNVVHFQDLEVCSYYIANDSKYQTRVFYRDFTLTVRQVVEKFGDKGSQGNYDLSKFSYNVQRLWKEGRYEESVSICHFVVPNTKGRRNDAISSAHKKYVSLYYERGATNNSEHYSIKSTPSDIKDYLSIKGFDYFPVLAPKWEKRSRSSYGTDCPGMKCIGDIKQLQAMEYDLAEAAELGVRPPMVASKDLENQYTSIQPGDVVHTDGQFREAFQAPRNTGDLHTIKLEIQERIKKAFQENLFLQFTDSDRRQITATEVIEKKQEKLLILGPVLQNLRTDLLDPLIEGTFNMMMVQGLIPEPPEGVKGSLKVEYSSIMTKAQKRVGVDSVELFLQFMANLTEYNPYIIENVNMDQLVSVYGEMISIPPGILRDEDEIEEIREGRMRQEQAQRQSEMLAQEASTIKDLSQSKVGDETALKEVVGALSE